MLNITNINSFNSSYIHSKHSKKQNREVVSNLDDVNNPDFESPKSENLIAYHPSFSAFWNKSDKVSNINNNIIDINDNEVKYNIIKSKLDKTSIKQLENLKKKGILDNRSSNDGSSVVENLYNIISEPRINGLDETLVLKEVIKALNNPFTITQKYGDIPNKVVEEIEKETGNKIPKSAKNVVSSSCVAASIEFNLADRNPAEFARFASELSSKNYSVDKNIKISDFSENFTEGIWKLREFNTLNKLDSKGKKVLIKLKPDRNAIVRARVQTSYKDEGERSCVDVLIQSAILNFASQNTYNAITDERTGKFNPDKTGLTDFEKNFAEQVVFGIPKYSVVYQNLDENGVLVGYNCTQDETKQHILKSLDLGQNVIIGYTHLDDNNKVDGGHEITIIGYEPGKNGIGNFICNDTDDGIDAPIKIKEDKLLPLIHHAGISKEALNPDDTVVEPWREHLSQFKNILDNERNKN